MIRRLVAKVAAAVAIFALFAIYGATNSVTTGKGMLFLLPFLFVKGVVKSSNCWENGFLAVNGFVLKYPHKHKYYNRAKCTLFDFMSRNIFVNIDELKNGETRGTIVDCGNAMNFKLD